MNYFDEIHVRLEKYKNVHKDRPRVAILKMLIWNGLFFIKPPREERKQESSSDKKDVLVEVDKSKFNVGFLLNGGIGDYVILANYIYKFRQKYDCPLLQIDVLFSRNGEAVESLFGDDIVDRKILIEHDEIYGQNIPRKYDMFIDIDRYPLVTNRNLEKINCNQPLLLDYMLEIDRMRMQNPRLFSERPLFDGQSAMISSINNIKRIQQADVGKLLGIRQEFEYPIPVREKSEEYLASLGLKDEKYIVVVSGADPKCGGSQSNKIWSAYYYDDLLGRIKEKYPELVIVQVGANPSEYRFKHVDVDLMGKTSFEDTKVILKYAYLLIGNEGGMVHLRYALHGGKSIVLFGSTDEKFFGYDFNVNIRGKGCAYPCEWLYKDWQLKCKNKNQYACMWSITPMMVMEKVTEVIEGDCTDGK